MTDHSYTTLVVDPHVWERLDAFLQELWSMLNDPDVPRLPLDASKWEIVGGDALHPPEGDGWWLVATAGLPVNCFDVQSGWRGLWARPRKAKP